MSPLNWIDCILYIRSRIRAHPKLMSKYRQGQFNGVKRYESRAHRVAKVVKKQSRTLWLAKRRMIHTTAGIRWSSPTQLLTCRSELCCEVGPVPNVRVRLSKMLLSGRYFSVIGFPALLFKRTQNVRYGRSRQKSRNS